MKPSTGVVEVDGSPRGRGYRWLCRARGVWRRGGSGEASVAAGGRAAAPGRVQADDAPRGRRVVVELGLQRRGAYDGTRVERRLRLQGSGRRRSLRNLRTHCFLAPGARGRLGSLVLLRAAAAAGYTAEPHRLVVSRRLRRRAASRGKNTPAPGVNPCGAPALSWDIVPEPSGKPIWHQGCQKKSKLGHKPTSPRATRYCPGAKSLSPRCYVQQAPAARTPTAPLDSAL